MILCKVGKCPVDNLSPICCMYCTKSTNCLNACKHKNKACDLQLEEKKEPSAKGSKLKILKLIIAERK